MFQTPKEQRESGGISATLVPHTPNGGVDVETYGTMLNPDGTPQVSEKVQDELQRRYGGLGNRPRENHVTPQRTYQPSFSSTPQNQLSGVPRDSAGPGHEKARRDSFYEETGSFDGEEIFGDLRELDLSGDEDDGCRGLVTVPGATPLNKAGLFQPVGTPSPKCAAQDRQPDPDHELASKSEIVTL